jgi:hypothetical protein
MEVWVRGPWCDGVGLKVARRKVRNETQEQPVSRFGCLREFNKRNEAVQCLAGLGC